MIFFFFTIDYSIIIFFLILAAIPGYKVAVLLQGIFAVIATLIFIAEIIYCLIALVYTKPFLEAKNILLKIIDRIITYAFVAKCLHYSYIIFTDLKSYGDSLLDVIDFLIVLIFGGLPVLLLIAGVGLIACSDNIYDYIKGLLSGAAGLGIFHFFGIG